VGEMKKPRFLKVAAIIDMKHGVVLLQARDMKGRLHPEIAFRIWKAIKNELNLW